MTQEEEKELLLKDLCARLRSGIIVSAHYKDGEGWKIEDRKFKGLYDDGQVYVDAVYTNIENVKPYLRTMSSMTEEEDKEWQLYKNNIACSCDENLNERINELHDWFNEHHFDYRGLIEKGLALEAPEDMYK